MPIISRSFSSEPSVGGSVLASFSAVDARGRSWGRSRARYADQAAAMAASDAFDWTVQLRDQDFVDLLEHVEAPAKGNPDDFDLTGRDITLIEAEDFLYKLFAESSGGSAIKIAWWLKAMNNPTFNPIRDRAGHDTAEGNRVKDKAVAQDDAELTIDDVVEVV